MTGNQLKEHLRKMGITQEEAAEKMGVNRRTLQNWFKREFLDANTTELINAKFNMKENIFESDDEEYTSKNNVDDLINSNKLLAESVSTLVKINDMLSMKVLKLIEKE